MGHHESTAKRKLFPPANGLGILSVDESKVLMYTTLKDRKHTHTGMDELHIDHKEDN